MSERVLVAGAGGLLGGSLVKELKRRGHFVRAMVRSPHQLGGPADEFVVADALRPETLGPAFKNIDRVFSCVGASVIPRAKYGRRSFHEVDLPANLNLIRAAAGVKKFGYLSIFGAERLMHLNFVRSHERVVEELRASGLDYAVVRSTGFITSMHEILSVANLGLQPETNEGRARTNPIHEDDLAEFCADALFDERSRLELDVGGPDILSRREIGELLAGRSFVRVPVGTVKLGSLAWRPLSPRVSDLLAFIADILGEDLVAPCAGTRRLASRRIA